jgi:hypothetical protein
MTGAREEPIDAAARAFLAGAGLHAPEAEAAATPLEGGSDRSFARIRAGGRSAVLLSQAPGREVDSFIDVGRFLRRSGVDVPEIYAFDRERGFVLMEDVGDLHLEDELARSPVETAARRYRQAVGILAAFQTGVTDAMVREGLLAERIFDERALLGETDYFVREFIDGFCRIRVPSGWERERRLVAAALAAEPPVFMHRDFQSRNLLIAEDRLRVVDFQTAHRGPGLYDAASLLKDAYHPVPAPLRRSLVEELHGLLRERGSRTGEGIDEYYGKFVLAGIQRNLQALAAFAKLGLRKGKRRFLDSIPPGLALLEEGIAERGDLPALAAMATAIRSRIEDGLMKGT